MKTSSLLSFSTALLLAAYLAACSPGGTHYTDPQGRITFSLPPDWQLAGGNGTRFTAPDNPRVRVRINTVPLSPRDNLAEERDTWLDFHREKGFEVLVSETRELSGGFSGVEYAHTMEASFGKAIAHHFLLVKDDVKVAAQFTAPPDAYRRHLPVFEQAVRSIQTTGDE
ncbi:MAG: hypothetical protein GVY10_01415 [Verrucomicrobia bacterium]|jgi:hypothetical protein|nr:hypothetical protein [Verrucomicrobiota bacterium]